MKVRNLDHCAVGVFLKAPCFTSLLILFPLLFWATDPPGPPQIQGLNAKEVLTAGSLKRITCTSISGNPLASLKWFNGDKELNSIYLTRDNYASAEVAFVPKGSDNGGQLRCEATNMASMEPLVAIRNLTVDFAPEFAKITVRIIFVSL